MTINWDGHVLPCCLCYGDRFFVGNLLRQDLEEVWHGEMLVQSRHFILNYGPKQYGQSVCETGACVLQKKYINEPHSKLVERATETFAEK